MRATLPGGLRPAASLVAPLLLSLGLAAPLAAQADHTEEDHQLVKWSDLLGKGSTLQLYGFLRTDAQFDDSRFNDVQIPGYVRSEDPAATPGVGASKNNAEFAIHPRLTRFGMTLGGPDVTELGDAKLTGDLEIDFYNIGLGDSDSRTAIRMRRAFMQLAWEHWKLLAGQEWDLISPLYPTVNADLVMWGAGNTGDRRPQVRVEYDQETGPGQLSVTTGVGLSGAVSSANVVGGLRSGENSGLPMFAARVGYAGKTSAGGAYQLGVWGHYSRDQYDATGSGTEQNYDSDSIGVDLRVPILTDRVWLLGEAWSGKNLDDIRGGIFQGVDPVTGKEIEAQGGWLEAGYQATPWCTLHAGYSMDNPKNSDLSFEARSENDVAYLAARMKFGAVHCGIEYLNWTTKYIGVGDGRANRLAAYIAYYF